MPGLVAQVEGRELRRVELATRYADWTRRAVGGDGAP